MPLPCREKVRGNLQEEVRPNDALKISRSSFGGGGPAVRAQRMV